MVLLCFFRLSSAQQSTDNFVNSLDINSLFNRYSSNAANTKVNATSNLNLGSNWRFNGRIQNVSFDFTAPASGKKEINADNDYADDDSDTDGTSDYLDRDFPPVLEDVKLFYAVTANGVGIHVELMIAGLESRTKNTLNTYNRWGV